MILGGISLIITAGATDEVCGIGILIMIIGVVMAIAGGYSYDMKKYDELRFF